MNKYQMALDRMVCHICNSRNGIYIRDGRASEDMNTLQELIDKYNKVPTKFIPCKCGNNRRSHYYTYDGVIKIVTFECTKCGVKVSTIGNKIQAKKHWNEVMNNE